jgi:hypothetical protein
VTKLFKVQAERARKYTLHIVTGKQLTDLLGSGSGLKCQLV